MSTRKRTRSRAQKRTNRPTMWIMPTIADEALQTCHAPVRPDLELAVLDTDGPHALVFPCRRILGGWVKAETRTIIGVRPTHWWKWANRKSAIALFGRVDQLGQFGLFFRQQSSNRPAFAGVGLGFQQFPVVLDIQLNDPARRRAHAAKFQPFYVFSMDQWNYIDRRPCSGLIMIKLLSFFLRHQKQIATVQRW
jgi:hypothetical protein